MMPPTLPLTTYRLQIQPAFTFTDASHTIAYLARLGVSDIYSSPFFRAKPGSMHGYDICDFGELGPELGGEPAFNELSLELERHELGLILDFVPNHMAVEPVLNPWWRDMLEHGQASPYAKFFDVDWNPVKSELQGKVLLPFLGDHYGQVLDRGELVLKYANGGLDVEYGSLCRPIDPRCYPMVLSRRLNQLSSDMGEYDPELLEFLSILTALEHLPSPQELTPVLIAERQRESRFAKDRLAKLADASQRIARYIDDTLADFQGTPGNNESFDRLHAVLELQSYRLSYWKTASHEINFRRFFDINELAGLRVEEPAAFAAMHRLLLELIHAGKVTGVRLDHIDGLFDPAGYLDSLRAAHLNYDPLPDQPLYIVVEKILTGNEQLPNWPVAGTTGYDFMNDVSRLFVNPRNAPAMRRFYERFTQRLDPFAEVVYDCKKLITWTSLAAELNVLAHALNQLSESDRRSRDFTLDSLREALREVAICFPVYRTYVDRSGISEHDRQVVDQAIYRARRRNPAMDAGVFDFVRLVILPEREGVTEEVYEQRLRFAMKFQQYTGPLQAKGVEDTSFYRYNVLISLNEVGGDPQRFGGTVAQFHQTNTRRRERAPHALLATATHDTKRGEDARTRLHVLSEAPALWAKRVSHWANINADCRSEIDGVMAPDPNDEYLYYQALISIWPAGLADPVAPVDLIQRLSDYMFKALKEAKVHTSWISPNEAYEGAVKRFVCETLVGSQSRSFLRRFLPLQRRVAHFGMINSLAQLVVKLASPGVPDFFQGTELWEFSLVDPDNRRPVDYEFREKMLSSLEKWLDLEHPASYAEQSEAVAEMLTNWTDGRIKLFCTALGMRLRRQHPQLFLNGDYIPLAVEGEHADHIVAFARQWNDQRMIAVVPRLSVSLTGLKPDLPVGETIWGDTCLRLPGDFGVTGLQNMITQDTVPITPSAEGATVRIADLLKVCPIAMVLGR